MPGLFNTDEFPIRCDSCGSLTKKTIGWIKRHSEFTCGACGNLKQLDFKSEIAKVEGMLTGSGPPSKFDLSRLPPEIFSGIGEIIAWWGYLQFELGAIIRTAMKLNNDTGRVLTQGPDVSVLCNIIRTLTRSDHWIKDKSIRDDLEKLYKDVRDKAEMRNEYAHGTFGYDEKNNTFIRHLFRSPTHRVTPGTEEMNVDSLGEVSDEARDLWIRAYFLTGRLKALMQRRS